MNLKFETLKIRQIGKEKVNSVSLREICKNRNLNYKEQYKIITNNINVFGIVEYDKNIDFFKHEVHDAFIKNNELFIVEKFIDQIFGKENKSASN